jgi:hypothetical protein
MMPVILLKINVKFCVYKKEKKLNSVVLVSERTILTERPPLVGEVSANFETVTK